ncbi:MAG TPA: aminotransferase class I/II-fold pyridoxal phosphate-dependent enzyme, partial [Chloroflexota bacterium]|nr:aminotransferase class I/II-fold pyridoxal phosphate-dependent enzyme [Chloroflexota bacterium]
MSPWPARESADWAPDVDDLARLVTPRTRLIVVNIPHNPTGYLMTVQELATLLTFAEQRGITVLSDEVYEDLVLEGPDGPPRAASASASAVS